MLRSVAELCVDLVERAFKFCCIEDLILSALIIANHWQGFGKYVPIYGICVSET